MKHLRYFLSVCSYFFFWNSKNLVQAQNYSSDNINNHFNISTLDTIQQHFGKERTNKNSNDLQPHEKCCQTYETIPNIDKYWSQLLQTNLDILKNIEKLSDTLQERKEQTEIFVRENRKLIYTSQSYPSDCSDFDKTHCLNDKCRIQNHLYGSKSFLVACDDLTDGGGWTIIQRRINGSVDFFREWSEYKQGFGHLDGEFFIGLEKLYALTNSLKPVELLIQLKDFDDTLKYAKYDSFVIGNEAEKYVLKDVGKYTGNAGDSFSFHKGYMFTTKDQDNDEDLEGNCASLKNGAWWYESCQRSNLNGLYYTTGEVPTHLIGTGINWRYFHGYSYSMKFVQMMIRPKKL